MGDFSKFFKYMLKDAGGEVVDLLKDIVSLRPKTMVYLTGILFIIAWLIGQRNLSIALMVVFVGFLFYKYYVAGDWRREAKEDEFRKTQDNQAK